MSPPTPPANKLHSPQRTWAAAGGELLPSLVVFLVALPLCLGIAAASGAPAAAGLVTGIVGGIVVGMLAGAPLQVSGPAAGLTVIVFGMIQQSGLETLGITVLLAGMIQLLGAWLRIAPWFRAVSPAVVQGMLSGIGLLLFANQFHTMTDAIPHRHGWENLLTIPDTIAKAAYVPKLPPPAESLYRVRWLRTFGTLHDDQIRADELVGEVLPRNVLPTSAPPREAFARAVAEQREINARIAEMLAEENAAPPNPELAEVRGIVLAALQRQSEAGRIALEHLEAGRLLELHPSQDAAIESLVAARSDLKSRAWAFAIGLLTLAVLIGWTYLPKGPLRMIPGPLVAVTAATIPTVLFCLPIKCVELPDRLLDDLHFPSWRVLMLTPWGQLLQNALVLAAVAGAETLLCCAALDRMQSFHRTDYDRELFAQGVGNMVCGFLGGLPMTGVIVRSAANVQSGARTRLSTILHGLWLLLFVVLAAGLLRLIPTSALAATLVYTGWRLLNLLIVPALARYGWAEVGIWGATLVAIIAHDLLFGVILGTALSALKLLGRFSKLTVRSETSADGTRADLHLEGAATFLRLPHLAAALEKIPRTVALHVHIDRLTLIDHACLELISDRKHEQESRGGSLAIDWDRLAEVHGSGLPIPTGPSAGH